ncbi:MAG: hypothetical protein ACRD6B_07670 [Bryobacteraceae bacterium]
MAAEALPYGSPVIDTEPGKRISWAAVFGGTLVALATELLLGTFGLFIAFTQGRGVALQWGKAWYFVTIFVALFVGGWVAAKLSRNTYGTGRVHGAVVWGLTTFATFMVAAWLFWGALSASLSAVRTAAVTANTATPAAATNTGAATQTAARQIQRGAANTVAGVRLNMVNGDASTLFLVLFGGIVAGCVGGIWGGGMGRGIRGLRRPVAATRPPTPMERAS